MILTDNPPSLPLDGSRRDFTFALACLGGSALGLTAVAQEPKVDPKAEPKAEPKKEPEKLPDATTAMVVILKARFGAVMTDEIARKIAPGIARRFGPNDGLKRVPLTNADEPSFVFRADV